MLIITDHADISDIMVSVRHENGKTDKKPVKDLTDNELRILMDNINKQFVYPS